MCCFFIHIMTLFFILHFQHDNPYLYLEARSLAPAKSVANKKCEGKKNLPKTLKKRPLTPPCWTGPVTSLDPHASLAALFVSSPIPSSPSSSSPPS